MTADIFNNLGGEFNLPVEQFKEKLWNTKALIFDWDGIFNSGEKGEIPSTFNEIDSMGVNMMRFGLFLVSGSIPYTAIATGETNETAIYWAKREHLDNVFFQAKNKVEIIGHLIEKHQIESHEIMFVFDDILDLSLAREVGVRCLVRHHSTPLFHEYCRKNKLFDYLTANTGSQNAVREIAELVLSSINNFEETIEKRVEFEGDYKNFLQNRNSIQTQILKASSQGFEPAGI